ncbi:hypothetical protein PILCRDRAFT_270065 [Piloderma croceum F 1598]|uniref:Uncharacterized protein n=1 Tax=Piloderma croceum (strain F 1598) TaxID=765440 RepID=A0A0C3CEC6_PILCF|nr:hypothetical protein PILCRDRAFT_270065 [Piloderma croceum F 1598]
MFASPVANTYETLYQQALDREMLASLDSGWDLCCCFEGYSVLSGVKQLWVWWAVPTRHSAEREAADAGIATIPGGISLKVTELHFTSCYRGLDIDYISQRQVSMLLRFVYIHNIMTRTKIGRNRLEEIHFLQNTIINTPYHHAHQNTVTSQPTRTKTITGGKLPYLNNGRHRRIVARVSGCILVGPEGQ